MMTSSLLLLLAVVTCVHGIELIQPSHMDVKPGESFSISCKISGFSTSHYYNWIRHSAGKTMEWIGWIGGDSGQSGTTDSLKSKISFTRDTSTNTVVLQGQNFQTEDTAVYYCTRNPGWAFDYWGKGTMVTVAPDTVTNASISTMGQCQTNSSASKTYACVTTGPFPGESAKFTWTKGGQPVRDFVEYPAVHKSGDDYTRVSTINALLKSDEDMTCTVTHQAGHIKKSVRVDPKSPTLSLFQISTTKGRYLLCAIEEFYPKEITVKWMEGTTVIGSKSEEMITKHLGYYYAKSFLELSSVAGDKHVSYTCEVTHSQQPFQVTKSFEAHFSVELTPPSSRDIFLNNKAVLECVTTGTDSAAVKDAKVTWKVGGGDQSSRAEQGTLKALDNGQFSKVSKLEVDVSDWFSGKEVECLVYDKTEGKNIVGKKKIKQGGAAPEVFIYTLPEAKDPNHVSLVCEVRGSSLGDVYIMWQFGEGKYQEGKTALLKQDDGNTSLVSILIDKSLKKSEASRFTCAVKHGGMKNYSAPLQVTYSKRKYSECPVCV